MTIRAQSRVMPSRDPLLAFVPLPFEHIFYPHGFPVQVKSNEQAVLEAAERSWGRPANALTKLRLKCVTSFVTAQGSALPRLCVAPSPMF